MVDQEVRQLTEHPFQLQKARLVHALSRINETIQEYTTWMDDLTIKV